jgi:hypothetical protein
MSDLINEGFVSMLSDEPPMRVTVDSMCRLGRRRAHQRRVFTVAGLSVVMAATTATAAIAVQGAGVGTAPSAGSPTPSGTRRALVLEIPRCDGDGRATDPHDEDGSALPDPQRAAAAVLAAAPSIAPGRSFRLVIAERDDTSAKAAGIPRVYIILDVGTDEGVGSLNMEILAQKDGTPAQRAASDLAAKPFSNCVPAVRTDFPDGSVGLAYTAFGTGSPSDTVQHVYYYANGIDVNAGLFLEYWHSNETPRALPPVTTMPLTPDEVLAIARLVADVGPARPPGR